MPKFTVAIREVHISHRIVEAETVEQAVELAGDEEEKLLEYSHTLDNDKWVVTDSNGVVWHNVHGRWRADNAKS